MIRLGLTDMNTSSSLRLGVLGLLPPTSTSTSDPNLSLLDLKSALRFTRRLVPSLGGDAEKITVAGHSSGGQMVRGK